MKEFHKFILAGVVGGLLVNVVSAEVALHFPALSPFLYKALIVLIGLWLIYGICAGILALTRHLRAGRYAVLLYVLNDSNQLLLVYHPLFKKWLPAGGRVKVGEVPDVAVRKRLSERVGIEDDEFVFHPSFHPEYNLHTERVEDLVRPYAVQQERRQMRGFVPFHYAFVYVCRYTAAKSVAGMKPYRAGWYSMGQIKRLAQHERPFDDALFRYEEILKVLGNGMENAGK